MCRFNNYLLFRSAERIRKIRFATLALLLAKCLLVSGSVVAVSDTIQRPVYSDLSPATAEPANLFSHYLMLSPSAFQVPRGQVSFRNTMLLCNQVDVGITDNWSVGLNTILFPTQFMTAAFGTKVSVPASDMVRVGIQGQYAFGRIFETEAENNNFGFDYIQAVASIGKASNHGTIGFGMSLNRDFRTPMLTLAYFGQISPTISFITENQFTSFDGDSLRKLTAGVRISKRNHAFDISLLYLSAGYNDSFALPFVSYQAYVR
jgi:hypothetical protein